MKLHKRILRLHHFRNLGKDFPTELLLNADFDGIKHGGLVILVGENNVGKSNVLEGLKAFNNDTNFLCPIEDYEKQAQERATPTKEKATLSLIHTIENNQQLEMLSWVELKENQANEQAFEMSFYPFKNHIEMLIAQCTHSDNYASYSRISWFDNHFIQSIRESLETLLPCADDNLSHNKYCKELESSWNNFSNQYTEVLRLNEICLKKYIKPIERKKDKKKAKVAYENLKKALLLHICLTFKECGLSKIKQGATEFRKQKSKELEQAEETFRNEKCNLLSRVEEHIPNIYKTIARKHIEELLDISYKKAFESRKNMIIDEIMRDNDIGKKNAYDCFNEVTIDCLNKVYLQMTKEFIVSLDENTESNFYEKFYNLMNPFQKNKSSDSHIKSNNRSEVREFVDKKYQLFKESINKARSIAEVIRYCEDFDRYSALRFLRESSELFHPYSRTHCLKGTVIDKAIWQNYLPQIINCDNPFELKDEDLYADILENIHHNRAWQTMCFEWYKVAPVFVYEILNMKVSLDRGYGLADSNFYFDTDKYILKINRYKWLEINLTQEISSRKIKIPQNTSSHNILYMGNSTKLTNNEKTIGNAKAAGYIFQIYLNIDEKYNATFTFYDLENNFLFDKKTKLLYELKKELKKMGEKISKEFNESYCINPNDEHRYIFEFRLKKQHFLHIRIKRDNEYLELAKQSTGFQWFFNLVFNFLYPYRYHKENCEIILEGVNHDNIVVIDEPAMHLSVPAVRQFRERLRQYGKKKGITFVLATHDPFLVDTNHLDEIRIVERQTNGSVIHNEFNYSLNNASNDSDALDKIKRSLGVEQHIFHNPRKHRIIFVEGITDYCYLGAFKLYFNERYPQYKDNPINFTFLPISGLKRKVSGEDKLRETKETIKKLCELDSNPVVLIDDDSNKQSPSSEYFKQANKELGYPIKILQLSQSNENFKQIEDLFSDEDQQEYSLENKNRELAIAFKNKLYVVSHKLNNNSYQYPLNNQDVVSKQTEINFLHLFEWIACNLSPFKN
ncbi:ATP-dependent nuclease [Helicobacter cetorum]|uniref:ATP-dependent nuclease n=1 Tax=Helicobacter cetorum TaxID=138563 RepID=UPI001F26A588|nr:AAA family ATPase [Helicobacter cetorum]